MTVVCLGIHGTLRHINVNTLSTGIQNIILQ